MEQLLNFMPIIWGSIILITIVIELLLKDIDAIWFTISAVITLILSFLKVNLIIQLSVFVVSTCCLLFTVGNVLKRLYNKKNIVQNLDSLLGKEILVIESVDEFNYGSGVIDDVVWTLTCNPDDYVEKGKHAIISGISGNKLIVTRKSN